MDQHYTDPRLVSIYDLGNGWSDDRDFYLSLAGQRPQRILDVGCGTGLLCNAYAEKGHLVTGVDPSACMLAAAKNTQFGQRIEWVQASAQSFQSEKKFELVVMTGHAFQVLLNDHDVINTFSRIREHLDPAGMFAFETRNPRIDWAREWHGMRRELQSPTGVVRESFTVHSAHGDRITFETKYDFAGEQLVSVSELRFMPLDKITQHLNNAGLAVRYIFGDWDGAPLDPDRSREMIFIAIRA
jgi:SAM-dependent methyltransferase